MKKPSSCWTQFALKMTVLHRRRLCLSNEINLIDVSSTLEGIKLKAKVRLHRAS